MRRSHLVWALLASGLGTNVLWAQPLPPLQIQPAQPVTRTVRAPDVPQPALGEEAEAKLQATLAKAHVDGKYRTLLRQIAVPDDAAEYGPFHDLGLRTDAAWKGFTDLPKGYWVYVQPYWFIWCDLAATPLPQRNWGPEQLIGAPNTDQAGDIVTAWASRTQDGQNEWLLLEYAEPVVPTALKIYETYNPGAVNKITAFALDGQEVELWHGADPTRGAEGVAVFHLQFKAGFRANRIKVYLDSPGVPGWNEIDAVGLFDAAAKPQWATSVVASTTYAEPETPVANPAQEQLQEERIARLEAEVAALKAQIAELERRLAPK